MTDPPPDADPGWVRAAYDALPPGGHLVARGDHRLACALEDAGFEVRDSLLRLVRTRPERWWLARRPLDGTVAANVLRHGTGALNIDGTRIGTEGGTYKASKPSGESNGIYGEGINGTVEIGALNAGRWPANVLLDEEAAVLLDAQAGDRGGGFGTRGAGGQTYGEHRTFQGDGREVGYGDRGGPSRFFFTGDRAAVLHWLRVLVTPSGGTCLDPFRHLTVTAA